MERQKDAIFGSCAADGTAWLLAIPWAGVSVHALFRMGVMMMRVVFFDRSIITTLIRCNVPSSQPSGRQRQGR